MNAISTGTFSHKYIQNQKKELFMKNQLSVSSNADYYDVSYSTPYTYNYGRKYIYFLFLNLSSSRFLAQFEDVINSDLWLDTYLQCAAWRRRTLRTVYILLFHYYFQGTDIVCRRRNTMSREVGRQNSVL